MPVINNPPLNKRELFVMQPIPFIFNINRMLNNIIANIQNGVASFVRKNKGIPTTVTPTIASIDINAMQIEWHN